jgi:hypothetical protein
MLLLDMVQDLKLFGHIVYDNIFHIFDLDYGF